ncbi:cupin-like domain-containing protein [Methylocapsa aurea]|uniref:cupin-like domain-containing protein n=1 Tax=Methylocapsa aurea TaxID=663610 RepID=UPI00068ED255|nr:cupin-like domain-containing protein [Methylocapsa aurea]
MTSLSNQVAEAPDVRIIGPDEPSVWKQMNCAPFTFRHNLANHPLFDLAKLASLATAAVERGDPAKFGFRIKGGDAKFNDAPLRDRLFQAVERIEAGGAFFKLSSLEELDEDYGHILRKTIGEVEDITGLPLRQDIGYSGLSVFVASPNMVTPYHFDADTNFLFQVRGEKDVRLFDPKDRFILTEPEIERFYAGNPMSAIYRDEVLESGTVFHLDPGIAVHHPPLAPHIVSTGNNVSVSVSMWFILPPEIRQARIYQANFCLRLLGLQPLPPGRSKFQDRVKTAAFESLTASNPKSIDELLYSGINRLKAPFRAAERLVRGRAA